MSNWDAHIRAMDDYRLAATRTKLLRGIQMTRDLDEMNDWVAKVAAIKLEMNRRKVVTVESR
jgi:hypothetical protein